MDIQRVRNLTTGKLHTNIGHVYEDIEYFIGEKGVMTHMLPNASRALEPYLRISTLDDLRFWDGKYDTTHTGDIDIQPMDNSQQTAFWERYSKLLSPLAGKKVVAIVI